MLALALALAALLAARAFRRRHAYLAVLAGLVSFTAIALQPALLVSPDGIFERFFALSAGNDLSLEARALTLQGAIDQFLTSPLFGSAIEEALSGSYPHNVTLEAFMATGLVGGLLFCALVLLALRNAWRLLKQGSGDMWLGLLCIQYVVAAQFSSSLHANGTMWVLMMAVLAYPYRVRRSQPRLRKRTLVGDTGFEPVTR